MLAAASLALNQAGEGSSPSGPTDKQALVVQRPRLRTRNAVTPVRVRPGALAVWQFGCDTSAHDVAAACCLARAEERVRLPLGALVFRTWESLASVYLTARRVPRAHEIAGSNPAVLTYCGGSRAGTGRRLLTAPTQVRFLPPQLACPWPSGRGARLPT